MREAGDPRLEQRPVGCDAGRAHRGQRDPVVAIDPRNDLGLFWLALDLPVGAGQLDARLGRLAPAAGEEKVIDRRVAQRGQPLGQLNGPPVRVAAIA